ncbi:MAG: hypothetical protein HQK58_16580 [Deltaproteobacteria bacterium]|nr:hypothetical protein [Deltaproteobacteria bacterium]
MLVHTSLSPKVPFRDGYSNSLYAVKGKPAIEFFAVSKGNIQFIFARVFDILTIELSVLHGPLPFSRGGIVLLKAIPAKNYHLPSTRYRGIQ